MFSSVLATFDESKAHHVKTVLGELKEEPNITVRGIIYGQLFGKMTASIFVSEEVAVQYIFEKLVANDIHIYAYNDDYKKRIEATIIKLKGLNTYSKDKIRTYYSNAEDFKNSRHQNNEAKNHDSVTQAEPVKHLQPKKMPEVHKKYDLNRLHDIANTNNVPLDKLCKEGEYIAIRNIVKNNPVQNQDAKEKYIPAIKNCIKINMEKGLENRSCVDSSIQKLKEIICDTEIKSIVTDDLISAASNALLAICGEQDPEELINVANLPSMGQKINVMAIVKLSEIIFENEKTGEIDNTLLEEVAKRINSRFVLLSYDVMEAVISEENKTRYKTLLNAIDGLKDKIKQSSAA